MNIAQQRENGRRSYELDVAMIRWNKLRAAYALARAARHGQRKAWLELRDHVNEMMRAGI